MPRDEAVRRALEDFGDAAELAARFSSIGSRRRWIMKGTAAAACIGFVVLGFNNLPTWLGGPSPAADAPVIQTTPVAQRHPVGNDDDDRDRRIFEALDTRVPELSFEEIPLEQVFDFIAEITGIRNFHVQWSRLEEAGIERMTLVTMKVNDLRAERVLRFILNEVSNDHAELQYAVVDGILIISTADELPRNIHVEVYDVRDLLTHAQHSLYDPLTRGKVLAPRKTDVVIEDAVSAAPGKELVDMIRNAIAPDSWQANGGTEYIQVYQGSLVVRQSDSVHAELARLLAALREPRKD
ncbi:MAG: hypothetical protein IID33_16510 [Planctomycetes bacterium]|nr:hypothetical protein [Planctomycetota bacterium]